jgi:hypothetical protein
VFGNGQDPNTLDGNRVEKDNAGFILYDPSGNKRYATPAETEKLMRNGLGKLATQDFETKSLLKKQQSELEAEKLQRV